MAEFGKVAPLEDRNPWLTPDFRYPWESLPSSPGHECSRAYGQAGKPAVRVSAQTDC